MGTELVTETSGKPSHLDAVICPREFRLFNVICKFLDSPSTSDAVSVAPTKRTNGQSMVNVQKVMLVRESGSI